MQPGKSYQAAEWSPLLSEAVQQGHTLADELRLPGSSVGASEGLIVPAPSHSWSLTNQAVGFPSHVLTLRCFFFFLFFANPNCLMTSIHNSADLSLNLWPHAFLIEHDCSINS